MFMESKSKKIVIYVSTILAGILLIYLIFFAISVIPAIILAPFIVYESIKEGNWGEIPLYYKLIIICGGLILVSIILKMLGLFEWIENKLK